MRTAPYARGVPLAPAAWVDVTDASGSVASTAQDMNRFAHARLPTPRKGEGGSARPPTQAKDLHQPCSCRATRE